MITIKCLPNGELAVKCFDGKKALSFEDSCYAAGIDPPRYPVPSTLGPCTIDPDAAWIVLYASDHERPNPLITWYDIAFSEANELPVPEDHGIPVEEN